MSFQIISQNLVQYKAWLDDVQRLRTVTSLDVSAVAGHHAMPAALLFVFFSLLVYFDGFVFVSCHLSAFAFGSRSSFFEVKSVSFGFGWLGHINWMIRWNLMSSN